jgi:hypothetical protein
MALALNRPCRNLGEKQQTKAEVVGLERKRKTLNLFRVARKWGSAVGMGSGGKG